MKIKMKSFSSNIEYPGCLHTIGLGQITAHVNCSICEDTGCMACTDWQDAEIQAIESEMAEESSYQHTVQS